MTEFAEAVEAPYVGEDTISRRREIAAAVIALAAAGGLSTAAEANHWLDHTNRLFEFFQDSGRHFLVGYLGAMANMTRSKAETFRGKLGAALVGGLALDAMAEAGQSVVITGILHHGSLHDMMGIFEPSQIPGNALDALAAETAAVGAAVQYSRQQLVHGIYDTAA